MEGQDRIKLSKFGNSKLEHARETVTDPFQDPQDETKANYVDVLDENANNFVRKEIKTQGVGKNPLLHTEDDQKDANTNVSGTGDVKPTDVGLKNICMGSIREKIKKQLELKKTLKYNETREEFMKESITQKEAQKVNSSEEDNTNPTCIKKYQEDCLINFDRKTIDVKDNQSDQDTIGIRKNEEEPLLKSSPEKIDRDMRDESTRRLMTNKEVSSFLLSVPPKKLVTAEELAAISRAASSDKWVVYDPKDGDLAEWLDNNKPSTIRRSDGVGWIAALADGSIQEKKDACEEELKEAWEAVVARTDQINTNAVRKLAKQFEVTGGKWIFHVTTDRVDVVWRRVATALHAGKLGPNISQAKVSPVFDTSEGEVTGMGAHVISVYNRDFTHEEQVLQVETSLRQAKIRCMFQYKPQIYSILGIYRNNRWGLRPTIYHSQYHLKRGKSIIESTFENTWFRNETEGFGDDNAMERRKIVSDKTGSNIGVHDATQSKKNPVKKIKENEKIKEKCFTDPNKIKVVDKETNSTVQENGKVVKNYLKHEYEKPKDEGTIEEDPGMTLLKGLGIHLDKPKERSPLDMNDITRDRREVEVEMKDDPRPRDMEELRTKVLSWLLTGEESTEEISTNHGGTKATYQESVLEDTEDDSDYGCNNPVEGMCVAYTSINNDKVEISTNHGGTKATYQESVQEDTEDDSDYDGNNPMEGMRVVNTIINNDKDVMGERSAEASADKSFNKDKSIENNPELVSLKVTNVCDHDADDESTPMQDDMKEMADLKKPSWLRNLQNKVTKNS